MWNAGLDDPQAGIKIVRGNINNLRYAGNTTLMGRKWRKLKSLLMKVKEESEKAGLKLSFQKTKIIVSSLTWQIDGEIMEIVADFIFLGFKVTVNSDCSHGIKRYLLLERKTMTNLDSILKSRDITLLKMVHIIKAMAFPVVMYRCKIWTLKCLSTKVLMPSNCGAGEDSFFFFLNFTILY